MDLCLAVDIGGTKVSVGVVDGCGKVLDRRRAATPQATEDPEALMTTVRDLVQGYLGSDGLVVVGVGCGGPMEAGGVAVSPLNIPAWRGFPLAARLAELTGLEVYVDNDAKALALGEWWKGAAVGAGSFVAVIVGTGVGGGLVVDGRLLDGNSDNAGHIGHVTVEPEGRLCGCGARGCLEAEASGGAIARIVEGDPADAGFELVERTGTMVGRAVASVANLLDLKLAVVAGSVALGYGEPFFAAAQQEIDRRARLDFSAGCRIRPAGLGDAGPLIGAAAVGWRGLGAPGPWQ